MPPLHKVVAVAALLSAASANASSFQDNIVNSMLGRPAVTNTHLVTVSVPDGRFEDRLAAAISPPVMLSRAHAAQTLPASPAGGVEADLQDRIIASITGRH